MTWHGTLSELRRCTSASPICLLSLLTSRSSPFNSSEVGVMHSSESESEYSCDDVLHEEVTLRPSLEVDDRCKGFIDQQQISRYQRLVTRKSGSGCGTQIGGTPASGRTQQ